MISIRRRMLLPILISAALLAAGCQPGLSQIIKPAGGARFSRFTATPTFTPSPTMTPTEVIIALPGTPFPTPQATFSPQNAAGLEEIAAWGRGKPQAIAWSGDEKTLAVATSRGIYLYNAQTLQISGSVGTSNLYRSLAYSPDGRFLAAGSDDGKVSIWDGRDYSPVAILDGHEAAVLNLTFSPSGDLLASGYWDDSINIWQVSGELSSEDNPRYTLDISPANGVQALAFSQDENEVFIWSPPAEVLVIDLSTAETRSIYTGRILDDASPTLEFSPGSQVIAIENDGLLQLYHGDNGYTLYKLSNFQEDIETMVFSPDGEMLATAGSSHIDIWQVNNGNLLYSFDTGSTRSFIRNMAFSADGSRLALLGDRLRLLDLQQDGETHLSAGTEHFNGQNLDFVRFLDNGNALATGWTDGALSYFSVPDDALMADVRPPFDEDVSISSFALSPDGETAAAGSWDGRFFLWRVSGDEAVIESELELEQAATCTAFSADGSLLAAGLQTGEILLWQVPESEPVVSFSVKGTPRSILLSAGADYLAVQTGSGIALWYIASEEPVNVLTIVSNRAAFSPDGSLLAVSVNLNNRRHVRLYRCEDGSPLGVIDTGSEGVLAFSPDGSLLAVSELDISLWSVLDGELLARQTSRAPYGMLAFSPDSRLLALSAGDGAIQLFGVP